MKYRFKDAWSFAAALDTVDSWTLLAETAVQHLDIEFGIYVKLVIHIHVTYKLYVAIRAYQQVKNISMVYSLQQIKVGGNRIPCGIDVYFILHSVVESSILKTVTFLLGILPCFWQCTTMHKNSF